MRFGMVVKRCIERLEVDQGVYGLERVVKVGDEVVKSKPSYLMWYYWRERNYQNFEDNERTWWN
jgi:hypothetical protein